jgi:hypothetical protein
MRVTLDAAMRARDVSRPGAEGGTGDRAGGDTGGAQPATQPPVRRSPKGERRRLGKRQAARRRDDQGTG